MIDFSVILLIQEHHIFLQTLINNSDEILKPALQLTYVVDAGGLKIFDFSAFHHVRRFSLLFRARIFRLREPKSRAIIKRKLIDLGG